MSKAITDFDSIKDVLKASIGSRVPIVFDGGKRLVVEVVAVKGNLLIASVRCRILTINIDCICAVIICCETILRFLLENNGKKEDRDEEEWGCLTGGCRKNKSSRRRQSNFRFESLGENLF